MTDNELISVLLGFGFVLMTNAVIAVYISDIESALRFMLMFNAGVLIVAFVFSFSHARGQSVLDARVASGSRAAPSRATIPRIIEQSSRVRLLAVLAWAEAGAEVSAGEVAAFDEVIRNRAGERGSYKRVAWQYSAGLRNRRYRWLFRVDPDYVPEELPAYVREHWPRVFAASHRVLRGEVEHGCAQHGDLMHWGGPRVDADNIEALIRRGYARAQCGYHNVFLARRVEP